MHHDDTAIGGASERFPTTRHSIIINLSDSDAAERVRAHAGLVSAYWKPVYKYLRLKWQRDSESAKDLTQSFFLRAMEKEFFARYDPAKARFRTYLRTCLDRFVQNEDRAAARLKRGGGARIASLDFATAESELHEAVADPSANAEALFELEWVRSLLATSVEALREHCRENGHEQAFAVFERRDLGGAESDEPVSYRDLAAEFGVTVDTVTNRLAYARREFRRIVLEAIRELTSSDREFRDEVRVVLGIDLPE